MRTRRVLWNALGITATAVLVGVAAVNASGATAGVDPRAKLTIMAPAAPGGGWDLASRESQQVLRSTSVVNSVQVVNVPGAGGTIGLGQFTQLGDDPTNLMMTGTVMEGAITVNGSEATLGDTTPIARLAEDYIVFIVPANSPFQNLDDFIQAWRADPHGQAVGGGGIGGTDHLLTGLTARAAGIDPGEVNYVSYAGGGEVLTALLSNTVAVGVSGAAPAAYAADVAPPGMNAAAMSTFRMLSDLGYVLGPIALGAVTDLFGADAALTTAAVLMLAVAALFARFAPESYHGARP